ncbi:hypothetical protein F5Y08DRAFT_314396 [Xylaria arbuscula]|nr:hypothetical protein F5Y08DRAFT_314396 [Xylaria arbuscula]
MVLLHTSLSFLVLHSRKACTLFRMRNLAVPRCGVAQQTSSGRFDDRVDFFVLLVLVRLVGRPSVLAGPPTEAVDTAWGRRISFRSGGQRGAHTPRRSKI